VLAEFNVRMMKIALAGAVILSTCLASCAFLPSVKNKLDVRPIKYVPCKDNMAPNTSCGSVTVPPEEAEGFVVTVGWKRFNEITNQSGFSTYVNEAISAKFANFAVSEVVNRSYCKKGFAPEPANILGWEGSGDRGIYVVCNK